MDLDLVDAWWRAANYLSVGQIYLLDNPLLREPLRPEHIKPRLLGHWGTTPGLNLAYAHLNRVIRARDLTMIFVCGPGHGGPAMVANTYLEGSYSELYPAIAQDEAGMRALFRQFSFPGGVPSHDAPETPGSINEGGELGYALAHAYGAAFDNPDLVAVCVVGDGEAETGALAASWHSNKFLDPAVDGAVLPILHLNGYKIANPTVLARIPESELAALFEGYGHTVHVVEGDDPERVHRAFADTLDSELDEIAAIQAAARRNGRPTERPRWPMIVLRTPKGWTGPAVVDGQAGRGHLPVPPGPARGRPPEPRAPAPARGVDAQLPPRRAVRRGAPAARDRPAGTGRRSAHGRTPYANGGRLRRDLDLPDFRDYAVDVPAPDGTRSEPTRVLGAWLRDVVRRNPRTFRIVGPDETASNRLSAVSRPPTARGWPAPCRATTTWRPTAG
jgi:xylulose-5-phosphate/fructose-6-phosphate phosphoketolase